MKKIFIVLTIIIAIITSLQLETIAYSDNNEKFFIKGYDKKDIVKDSAGNVVPGHVYCLDAKADTPNETEYVRIKLSELNEYTKDGNVRTYDDEIKSRLMKILIAEDEIKSYAKSLDLDEAINYIVENDLSLLTLDEFEIERGKTLNQKIKEEINYKLYNKLNQILIWACVHRSSEWESFVKDNDNVSSHPDNYYICENNFYYYVSSDPLNDPYSLWNQIYKPILNYIDNHIPDYYALGWDAWVYTTNTTHQNMLGTFFLDNIIVRISKKDFEDGKELSGATFKIKANSENSSLENVTAKRNGINVELRKNSDNTELEFESGEYETVLSGFGIEGNYTITEKTAPNGYLLTQPIIFIVNSNGTITKDGSIVNGNRLIIDNKSTEVSISKRKITGGEDELVGAKFRLYKATDLDENGKVKEGIQPIAEWISGEDTDSSGNIIPHMIKGLSTGINYVVREIEAPKGFEKADDITFVFEEKDKNIVTVNGEKLTDNRIIIRDLEVQDPAIEIDNDYPIVSNNKQTLQMPTSLPAAGLNNILCVIIVLISIGSIFSIIKLIKHKKLKL